MDRGVNPLTTEPFYVMFGPGAGVSKIVDRETREEIPYYEPILLLRASDPEVPFLVRVYAQRIAGRDPQKAQRLKKLAEEMEGFLREKARAEKIEL